MKKNLIKNGYSFNKEYCGYPEVRIVVRYMGDWVSQHLCENEAIEKAQSHWGSIQNQFKGMDSILDRIISKYQK